jgi:hypothetical protein
MNIGSNWNAALCAAAVSVVAGSAFAVSDNQVGPAVPTTARDAAAFARLSAEAPGVRFLELSNSLRRVYGPNLSSGATVRESVEAFIGKYVSMFGVAPADLTPWSLADNGVNTTPLMPENDGTFRFTLTNYSQTFQGIPVFRGDLRLLTRNTETNDLVWVGNALRPMGDYQIDEAVLNAPNAQGAMDDAERRFPEMIGGEMTSPELMIFSGIDADMRTPRLALVFTATTAAKPWEPGYGKRLIVSDASTGMMLFSESKVHDVDVSGRVSGLATTGIRAAECDPEADRGLPHALVTIGAQSGYADANGNYTITGVPAGAYTASAGPRGRYFATYNPSALVPPTSAAANVPNVQLNSANTDQTVRAGVNAYLQANVVRDMVVTANPAYPVIGSQLNFRINVAVSGTCNAFYDGSSINFYSSGGGCNNTAFFDVVHHEFGHHVVNTGGSGQGQYGEGMGDCMGVIISDQPVLGFGFQTCASGIRTANNTLQYPQGAGVAIHTAGQLLSGCVWSTRNELVSAGVADYQTLLKRLCVNSVPLHSGTEIAPDITIDWLTLDDNDGNINNGTPHYAQINAGFTAHNMDGPVLQLIDIQFPEGLPPTTITPGVATNVRVNVVGVSGTPVDSTGQFSYRIDAGSNVSGPMTRIGPNQYLATIPSQACGSQVTYSFSAQAVGGSTLTSPAGAPGTGYVTLAVSGSTTRFADNFETNLGWVATNTPVAGGTASGNWARGPQLDTNGAAPTSDYDGSGQMYSTDPRAGTGVGTFDVDNNTVRLTSPTMDASGGAAVVSYARWFSNNAGASPDDDRLLVEVSGNNGSSWVTLEQVGPNAGAEQHGGWYYKSLPVPAAAATNQFKIRFTTSDNVAILPATTNAGSVTEASIDAVSLVVFECTEPTCAADFNNDGFLDFFDFDDFVTCFGGGSCPAGRTADFNNDGFTDFFDFDDYTVAFEAGC